MIACIRGSAAQVQSSGAIDPIFAQVYSLVYSEKLQKRGDKKILF